MMIVRYIEELLLNDNVLRYDELVEELQDIHRLLVFDPTWSVTVTPKVKALLREYGLYPPFVNPMNDKTDDN